jgi:hypothetical protein
MRLCESDDSMHVCSASMLHTRPAARAPNTLEGRIICASLMLDSMCIQARVTTYIDQ